jgi:hypothetical protein
MQHAAYVRISTDAQGESHFEDVEVEMAAIDFAPPAALLDYAQLFPVTSAYLVRVSEGWHGDVPHPAPRRQLYCNMAGEYEVTASDGEKRRFPGGSLLLLEDTFGKGHSTRVIGAIAVPIVGIALAD